MLAAAGADVNTQSDGLTVLMYAANWGDLELVKVLVEGGADINARDRYGRTALTFASGHEHTEIAEYLQSAGGTE